jgi:hypothetical protein
MFWKEGRNKKIIFSIHFDVDSKEFNQLVQTGHLDLGGNQLFHNHFLLLMCPCNPIQVLWMFQNPLFILWMMDGKTTMYPPFWYFSLAY